MTDHEKKLWTFKEEAARAAWLKRNKASRLQGAVLMFFGIWLGIAIGYILGKQ